MNANIKSYKRIMGANGRVLIPKAIRDRFGLKAGDILVFIIHDDETIIIKKLDTSLTPN